MFFLDLFSRKVVGWGLSDSLEASGTVRACRERCGHAGQQLACWFTAILEYSRVTKSLNGYYVGMPWC